MADRKCVNADLHYQNKPGFIAIELKLPLDSHVLKDHLAHEGCEQHHEYISSFLKKCISLNITIYFAQFIYYHPEKMRGLKTARAVDGTELVARLQTQCPSQLPIDSVSQKQFKAVF